MRRGWGEWVALILPRVWGRIEWSDVRVVVGWVWEWVGWESALVGGGGWMGSCHNGGVWW